MMNNSGQSVRSDVSSVSDTAAIDLAATALRCARYSAAFASFESFMSAFETDPSFKSNMAEILKADYPSLGLVTHWQPCLGQTE